MFISYPEWLKKTDLLAVPVLGTVIDNVDDKKLGRIKVNIPSLLTLSADASPWVYPLTVSALGGAVDSSGFSVPEVGAEVLVEFPYKSVYFAFYRAFTQNSLTHITDFDGDYPETYGFRDKTGNRIRVNKETGLVEIEHSSGSLLTLDVDGNLTIHNTGNKIVVVDGNTDVTKEGSLNFLFKGAVAGEMQAGCELTANLTINGNVLVNGDIEATGTIIDSNGNTNHHAH